VSSVSVQVSVDQSVVDLDIPFRLGGFAATTIQLIGIVGVMTEVTWQVLLLVIPMAIACLWMQVIRDIHIPASNLSNLFVNCNNNNQFCCRNTTWLHQGNWYVL
jgi:hypothetical protein